MESAQHNTMTSLVYWREWQKTDGVRKLFPSEESLYWFIRSNKQRLFDTGAVVVLRQRLHINPVEFERVGLEIARSASKHLVTCDHHA